MLLLRDLLLKAKSALYNSKEHKKVHSVVQIYQHEILVRPHASVPLINLFVYFIEQNMTIIAMSQSCMGKAEKSETPCTLLRQISTGRVNTEFESNFESL